MKPRQGFAVRLLVFPVALSTASLSAQETPIAEDDDMVVLEEFSVHGTRASLARSQELKRDSSIIHDTIVAEDVAKFPDLNLAESLQRLPGVAINREAGEGRRVSLRGMGPDFTRVQLNGMEVLGNVDSPQDSRGQGSRDRAFDFNIFASELFNQMDVYKSFDASQNEGGLAGTIGLRTAKPFDKPGFNGAVSAQIGSNTQTGDLQPRTAIQVSNTWGGKFGALVSVAYSKRQTEEQGTNTYRWRVSPNAGGSNISALSAQDQAMITSGQLRFARGNRLSVWQSDSERLGLTAALQWKPSENFDLTLDVLHGEFNGDRDELHMASRGANSSSWLGGGTTVDGVVHPHSTINEIRYNERNEVVYLDVSGGNVATETRRQTADNTFDQLVLTGNWRITDRLKAQILLGTETSEYDMPISDKFYLEAFGDVISDYTKERDYLHNTYGFDTTNPANWNAHEIDFSASHQESNFDNMKADFDLELNKGLALKFGLARQVFSNEGYSQNNDNVLQSQWQSGAVDDDITPYARVFSDHKDQSWMSVDFDAALEGFDVTRNAGPKANIFEIEERTNAAYVRFDWSTKLGNVGFSGNAGLRAYETKVTSSGTANVGPVTVVQDYDGILPSLNLTFALRENLLLRTAVSQNINRPTLYAMAVNGSISENNGEIRASVGNPGLEPYESDNYDVSLEWYFADVGYAAVGYYHKDITGFVGNVTSYNVPYRITGLPLDLFPGLTPDTNVSEFSRPVNYESTAIDGLEFTLQSDLTFLPGPFKNLGFVGNLSFIDGELDYASPAEQAEGISIVRPITGLSDVLGNVTLYYETKKWGARISANYRGGYYRDVLPSGDQDGDGYNSTVYIDLSAFYQLNEKMKLTFDVINLTDVREEQYSDTIARRHYNSTTAGTSFFGGVNYQF